MGLFSKQFANVVEWEEYRDDVLFWKWTNREIKKGSKLIIRPGQDAIFLFNGKIEGVFEEDGEYDIESEIVPFLSTLKGFKFGFNSGMRAEVLFINTKEFTQKWGTKNAIMLPTQALPAGMPVRCFGTFNFKIDDRDVLIDRVAGIKQQFCSEDVRDRIIGVLDQLLMKWISREGKDMFNLQANAYDIARGIQEDLDMEMLKIGITITGFSIQNFSYPEEVQRMQNKAASQAMVGDIGRYTQIAVADAMANGTGGVAGDMLQMGMAVNMASAMMNNMGDAQRGTGGSAGVSKFCPECGSPTNGAKFCSNCGTKLI